MGTVKFWTMVGCLVLTVGAVVSLRRELGSASGTPAEVTNVVEPRTVPPRLARQPTILQAKPIDVRSGEMSPIYSEQSPAAGYPPEQRSLPGGSSPEKAARSLPEEDPQSSQFLIPAHPAGFPLVDGGNGEQADVGGDQAGVSFSLPEASPSAVVGEDSGVRFPEDTAGSSGSVGPAELTSSADLDLAADTDVAGWPTDPAPVAAEQTRTYTTREDDSLWSISVARYGSGEYYKALFVHNRVKLRFPDRISAGIILETPPVDDLHRMYAEYCPTTPLHVAREQKPLSEEPRLIR